VNMFHLYIDAPVSARTAARDRIAREDGARLARRFAAAPAPGWLAMSDRTVAPLFTTLVACARQASA
jgi:hypothetical protein